MCGIVGYIGWEQAAPVLLEGLSRLEYRGYDSAGVAVYDSTSGTLAVRKAKGRLKVLSDLLHGGADLQGTVGIGHTRWATHGAPSDINSHPQISRSGKIAVVHNGIIENYAQLKSFLMAEGIPFVSETDTEVIAQLIEYFYEGDLLAAVGRVLHRIEGAYALGILCDDHPDQLIAVRKDSPLILGYGENCSFLASDVTAILRRTRRVSYMEDGEVAVLTRDGIQCYNSLLQPVEKEIVQVDWEMDAAEKGGYEHFMFKEIMEQPQALRRCISPRIQGGEVVFEDFKLDEVYIKGLEKIYIVACGSSYHVGMVGKYQLEKLTRKPVEVALASEFRYMDPIVNDRTLVVVISQSGETLDTMAALREARRLGGKILSIVNVVGSSIARESDRGALHLGRTGDCRRHHQGLLHPAGGPQICWRCTSPGCWAPWMRRSTTAVWQICSACPIWWNRFCPGRTTSSTLPLSTSTMTAYFSLAGISTTPWDWRAP